MAEGFLPFGRGTLIIDLVAVALVAILPLFSFSLYVIKYRQNYQLHKRLQIFISATLAIIILFFEIEMRFFGWRHLAEESAYFDTLLYPLLMVHLVVAITTVTIWSLTMYRALKFFSKPPSPGAHSVGHKRMAKVAAIGLYLTIGTGWLFYYVAFVA